MNAKHAAPNPTTIRKHKAVSDSYKGRSPSAPKEGMLKITTATKTIFAPKRIMEIVFFQMRYFQGLLCTMLMLIKMERTILKSMVMVAVWQL